jgi:hypothetical protein
MTADQSKRAFLAWNVLISCAENREKITYKELAKAINIRHHRPIRYVLGDIQDYCQSNDFPPLTALVVNQSDGLPGKGFTTGSRLGRLADLKIIYSYNWHIANPFSDAPNAKSSRKLTGDHGSNAYWWLNTDPNHWDLNKIAVGEREPFTSRNKKGNKRRIYKYYEQAQPGDLIIGYITTPLRQIAAICQVTRGLHHSEEGEAIEIEKILQLPKPISYNDLKGVRELADCETFKSRQGTLFALTPRQFDAIVKIAGIELPANVRRPIQSKSNDQNAINDLNNPPLGITDPQKRSGMASSYIRDPKVRDYVLVRSEGCCEYCGTKGFLTFNRKYFVETHHIIALSDDGQDTVENVIALCPDHHKEAHYGMRRKSLEKKMIVKIRKTRCGPEGKVGDVV